MKHKCLAVLLACLLSVTGCTAAAPASPEEETLAVITTPYPNMLTGETASAEELLADMTLREKITQMLMPAFLLYGDAQAPVTVLSEAQKQAIRAHHFGGIILFSENIADPAQTVRLVDAMQSANAMGGRTGLLIAVDAEGGQVNRLACGSQLCGSMALGAADSEQITEQASALIAEELQALGIMLDFAPSLDVNSNPANPVIGVRSFSDDPQIVLRQGKAYIRGMQSKGVMTALKHFPGHGDTDTDSHTGLPLIDKSAAQLEACELLPFREAAEEGVDMLMTAHIQFPQIEPDTYTSKADGSKISLPATLSDDVIGGIVRKRMGYDGVIITDAMNMDAIQANFDPLDAARLAINAGVDMLLMPVDTVTDEQIKGIWDYISGIEQMVQKGDIPEARIDESALRILKLKEAHGILAPVSPTAEETEQRAKAAAETVGSKAHHEQEMDITKQTVTLVKNEDDLLPLDGSGKTVLLCPYDSELNSLEYAASVLKADGTLPKDAKLICKSYENGEPSEIGKLIEGADTVVAVSALYDASELDPAAEDGKAAKYLDSLLTKAKDNGTKCVLISAQLPYDLARYRDADAALACYLAKGMTEKPGDFSGTTKAYGPNLIAAVYTVFGGSKPTGKLPVNVPELDSQYQYTDALLYKRGTGLEYPEAETSGDETEE